jgi:mannose-1-phosphate guanylyltransferase/mannose-6-phosphate isomerase
VVQFVEKPDPPPPSATWPTGGYFWNAGMFVLQGLGVDGGAGALPPRHRRPPARRLAVRAAPMRVRAPGQGRVRRRAGGVGGLRGDGKCPGVLDIRMEPLAAGWNDLGAWEAVWQVADKDAHGNASVGDAIVSDSRNTLVHATSRLVSAVGLRRRGRRRNPRRRAGGRPRAQPGREAHRRPAGREQRGEHTLHRKVHRPWGWYDSIDTARASRSSASWSSPAPA